MSDLVIRDVPEDVIAALDAAAKRLGLSRDDYLRRRLAHDEGAANLVVNVANLRRAAEGPRGTGGAPVFNRAWEGG